MSTKLTKSLDVVIKADADSHSFTAAISTNAVDRDGEVLMPQGMDATEFDKNPVVFYNHDYNKPIGKQVGKFKRDATQIVATAEFAKRPADLVGPWFPDEIRGLVQAGVVKGVSVGFSEVEGGCRQATKIDKDHFGAAVSRVFSMWKLLEWSIAPLQSNPDALIQASHKGFITPARCEELFGVVVPERKTQVAVVASMPAERLAVYTLVVPGSVRRKRNATQRNATQRNAGDATRSDIERAVAVGLTKKAGGLYG